MKRNRVIFGIWAYLLVSGLIVINYISAQEKSDSLTTDDISFQETIDFDDFSTEGYEYGIMYIERKIYENNLKLVNEYKKFIIEMPEITKYSYQGSTFFIFTGYIIDSENNVCIMDVKLKLFNDHITIFDKGLLNGFNIDGNEIDNLIKTINEQDNYIIKGNDINGSYSIYKNLYANDSSEIEDNFGIAYAYILYFNNNIDPGKISRRLMYYILEFTY